MTTLRILYFAWVRERVGHDAETVEPPLEVIDVSRLVTWLASRSAGHAEAFAEPHRLRAAIDGRFVSLEASLEGAREVSLFPPVTGG